MGGCVGGGGADVSVGIRLGGRVQLSHGFGGEVTTESDPVGGVRPGLRVTLAKVGLG
jgi:hypothetical protein